MVGGSESTGVLREIKYATHYTNIKKPSFARRFARVSEGISGAGGSRTSLSNSLIKGVFQVCKNCAHRIGDFLVTKQRNKLKVLDSINLDYSYNVTQPCLTACRAIPTLFFTFNFSKRLLR